MNIYRIQTGRNLFSFNDPIGEVPLLNESLKSFQEKLVKELGHTLFEISNLDEVKDQRFLAFEDDLVFTKAYLQACLKSSEEKSGSLEFFLEDNSFNQRFLFPCVDEGSPQWCYAFRVYDRSSPTFSKVLIKQKIFENYIKLPRQIVPSGKYHVDQCEVWISKMASPFHLLYANLALNFGRTIKTQKRIPLPIQRLFFPIGSRLYYLALKNLNKIGKGCKIHPTAVLEGAQLGDHVTIGANCVVRMSSLGSGTTIEDNAVIAYSVLGKDNYVSAGNFINLCMTYENVFLIHGPYQFSIYGKDVAVMAVINCDIRLDNKEIVIPTDKGLVNSRQALLGIAYGHGAVVGGGNIIAPGRIVPNGFKKAPPENIILTKFEGDKK